MECLVNGIPFAPGLKLCGINEKLQVVWFKPKASG